VWHTGAAAAAGGTEHHGQLIGAVRAPAGRCPVVNNRRVYWDRVGRCMRERSAVRGAAAS